MKLSPLRVACVVALGTVVVAPTGPAQAYWTAGSSTATGQATSTVGPTITATAAPATGLYPGATVPLTVTVSNPGDRAVALQSAVLDPVTSGTTGCAASVTATAPLAASLPTVPAGGSTTVDVTLRMASTAPDTCQGASFAVTAHLTGRQQ